MIRYADIDGKARNAGADEQLIYNEATIGRNIAENPNGKTGVYSENNTQLVPVLVGDGIVFRLAVFDKNTDEREVMRKVANGATFDSNFIVLDSECPTAGVFDGKRKKNQD